MVYDTIIIGAGMSGLAAGIRLSLHGQRVLILERHWLWGGLNSFYKQAGRVFDTGLHALTNYVPPRTRRAPLTRVLRQLRIRHEELRLGPQRVSWIVSGGRRLRFSNDPALLESELAEAFPGEIDAFRRLVAELRESELALAEGGAPSARRVLGERFGDSSLIDALMLPVLYYGGSREDDIGWDQFQILFRSILMEGLARPAGGIRTLLDLLLSRLRENGGELRLRAGVESIRVEDGVVRGVRLESGEELQAQRVFSSAGWVETARLCGLAEPPVAEQGAISFVETLSVLDRQPAELGFEPAIVFFNLAEKLRYGPPARGLCDDASGVVSAPGNYETDEPLPEGQVRVTLLAHPGRWRELDEERYAAEKRRWSDRALEVLASFAPDPRPHEVYRDVFTPRTIERFTGHLNGAVYGSPAKRPSGETGVEGLSLIGTDQGFLGIVGAMVSGIAMANRNALMAPEPR